MNDFKIFLNSVLRVMNVRINLYGFSFSLFDVFMFVAVASIVIYVVKGVFSE